MMVHHLIDELIKAATGRRCALTIVPGVKTEHVTETVRLMHAAEKFDFGLLQFERVPGSEAKTLDGRPAWAIPMPTDDERQFILQGLVPLPSNPCWYEFTLGRSRSGLLIHVVDGAWNVIRIDFDPGRGGAFDASWLSYDMGNLCLRGPAEWLDHLSRAGEDLSQSLQYSSNLGLAEYLTLILNSRTTERKFEPAPERLNRKRSAAGKTPLYDHTVVTIVPLRFRPKEGGGGTHASPRLHWRRSHKRHWKERPPGGTSVWMPDELWADPKTGEISKGWWVTVVPRVLVGKAELGEITHEYRVTLPTKENT